jgi:hypothetical protein
MDTFEFSYKTTLPKDANAPNVTIKGYSDNEYDILFYVVNQNGLNLTNSVKGKVNQTVTSNVVQWVVDWYIEVRLNGINYEPVNITSVEEVIENIKKYINH